MTVTVQLTDRQAAAITALILTIHHKGHQAAVNGPPVLTQDEMRDLVQRLMAGQNND